MFAGEFILSHCVTSEFFTLVKERLAQDGALFVNTNMNDLPFRLAEDEPFRAFRHLATSPRAT